MAQRKYPSYNIYEDNRGEWRWTYEAINGETIAVSSEGYIHFRDCRHSVEIMKSTQDSLVYVPADKAKAA